MQLQSEPSLTRSIHTAPFLETNGDVVRHPLEQIGESLARIETRLDALEKKEPSHARPT